MGRQDFAHNAAPSAVKSTSGITSVASVIAIIFISSACFTAGYWIGTDDMQTTSNRTDTAAIEAQMAVKEAKLRLQEVKIETLEGLVKQWKSKATAEAHTKVGELNFYKELPQQSVTPAPVSAKKVSPIKPQISHHIKPVSLKQTVKNQDQPSTTAIQKSSKHVGYRIQIASFRQHKDALPVQKRLIKAGFPAFIQQVELGSKGMWFRAYAGPFVSKSAALDSQQRLAQQLHLKGLLLRER